MKKLLKKLIKDDKEAPRELAEIEKEYGQLAAKLGQNAYQVSVLERDAKSLSGRMLQVNQEAFARQKLTAEAKKSDASVEAKDA